MGEKPIIRIDFNLKNDSFYVCRTGDDVFSEMEYDTRKVAQKISPCENVWIQ